MDTYFKKNKFMMFSISDQVCLTRDYFEFARWSLF